MRAVGLLALLGSLAFGQKPDAAEILHKVAAKYGTATQYHFVISGESTWLDKDGKIVDQNSLAVDIAMRGPDHGRIDGTLNDDLGPAQLVINGNNYWIYLQKTNRFLTHKTVPIQAEVGDHEINEDNFGAYLMQVGGKFLQLARRLGTAEHAELLREEIVKSGDEAVTCWVLALKDYPWPKASSTLWVDQKRYVVLREEDSSPNGPGKDVSTTDFTLASVNEPLPDSLFVFSRPAGAREANTIRELGEGLKP